MKKYLNPRTDPIYVLQMTLSHFHLEKIAGNKIPATGVLVKGPIEKVYPKMYRYAYDDELFDIRRGLIHGEGKVKTRPWDNGNKPTDEVKGGYWLSPENISRTESRVKRLQLITNAGPRSTEPKWKVVFSTDEVKNEMYVPFGGSRHTDKVEPLTDNHPEVNPGGLSGGATQFRSKDGATVISLEDMETGTIYEGEALKNLLMQKLQNQ